ncbi:H-type lectin domain-containing protein [uncultured Tateyamaria sp.]|uniref:H-type lectin domain-containing protein n=1 Tax=uncultured Tateyamaria sp. TaxID=455651 RepID=UPI00261959CF|nr:H-type lectin domain-containing protein [uncultured Tateyamaria sp.]
MKRLRNHLIGIDQGDTVLFSDFEDGGEMWTGRGQRERRRRVSFSEPFRTEPSVHVSISMWDVDTASALRADAMAETITKDGFDLVFRTWGDTRIARVRLAWMAMGELRQVDDWDLY